MPAGARADLASDGVFVPAGDLPDRFEENPAEASDAWRRSLAMGARLRAEAARRQN